ncbi:hypothetical protein H5410_050233 [Solanum commersonii]|uniref:Uncharacterized protein n=1 Tax=Solanum commersonii TaxID=4109 RepID=A0A9J5WXD1_SOLCO|nr:hypothetical protein H5410_050233 [Solanum commersonii]
MGGDSNHFIFELRLHKGSGSGDVDNDITHRIVSPKLKDEFYGVVIRPTLLYSRNADQSRTSIFIICILSRSPNMDTEQVETKKHKGLNILTASYALQ